MQGERLAGRRRDGLLRQVVAGWPEAAGRDQNIAALERVVHGLFEPLHIVADDRRVQKVDAEHRKRLRHDRRVGIDGLAEQQLGADR